MSKGVSGAYEGTIGARGGSGSSGEGTGSSTISKAVEEKILHGEHISPDKNKIKGGHSPDINNSNSKYAVEEIRTNADGTKDIKYKTQFSDGNLSKIKASTVFPNNWSNEKIISTVKKAGDTPAIGTRTANGVSLTLHRATINGVKIDVIKKGNEIISAYPVGNKPTPGFDSIK